MNFVIGMKLGKFENNLDSVVVIHGSSQLSCRNDQTIQSTIMILAVKFMHSLV